MSVLILFQVELNHLTAPFLRVHDVLYHTVNKAEISTMFCFVLVIEAVGLYHSVPIRVLVALAGSSKASQNNQFF